MWYFSLHSFHINEYNIHCSSGRFKLNSPLTVRSHVPIKQQIVGLQQMTETIKELKRYSNSNRIGSKRTLRTKDIKNLNPS